MNPRHLHLLDLPSPKSESGSDTDDHFHILGEQKADSSQHLIYVNAHGEEEAAPETGIMSSSGDVSFSLSDRLEGSLDSLGSVDSFDSLDNSTHNHNQPQQRNGRKKEGFPVQQLADSYEKIKNRVVELRPSAATELRTNCEDISKGVLNLLLERDGLFRKEFSKMLHEASEDPVQALQRSQEALYQSWNVELSRTLCDTLMLSSEKLLDKAIASVTKKLQETHPLPSISTSLFLPFSSNLRMNLISADLLQLEHEGFSELILGLRALGTEGGFCSEDTSGSQSFAWSCSVLPTPFDVSFASQQQDDKEYPQKRLDVYTIRHVTSGSTLHFEAFRHIQSSLKEGYLSRVAECDIRIPYCDMNKETLALLLNWLNRQQVQSGAKPGGLVSGASRGQQASCDNKSLPEDETRANSQQGSTWRCVHLTCVNLLKVTLAALALAIPLVFYTRRRR